MREGCLLMGEVVSYKSAFILFCLEYRSSSVTIEAVVIEGIRID